MDTSADLLEEAREHFESAVALRRKMHAHPEVGLELPITRELVEDALADLPVSIKHSTSTSGLVVDLQGSKPGPTVLLRADMDALPMPEDTEHEFASVHDNRMHACGHDLHTAMLVGAVKMLSAHKNDLAGSVRFMFQPGEEGYHGARFMLEDGLLNDVKELATAFAVHVFAVAPSGFVSSKSGALMASSDSFTVTVMGKGGHAAMPSSAIDPIPIACEIVMAIQAMITRRIDVFDPGLVTVGKITAGTTSNVIPETAEILGTIRAVSERTRSSIHDNIRLVATKVAEAHGATADVALTLGYPVTVNHNIATDRMLGIARSTLGDSNIRVMNNPVMGSEDWSYVLQQTPGSMAFLGACPEGIDPRNAHGNHSNRVMYNEAAMIPGMALYSAVALDHLR
jgi:amidohydrolase